MNNENISKTGQQKKQERREAAALVWRFLDGSKRYFVICIIAAAISSLADMLGPQVIRAAVDNAIGGEPASYPDWVMKIVDSFGGFSYLGQHLWIMAAALVAVALVRVVFEYVFRVSNTTGTETLVKTMRDTLFNHIERLPFSWHMLHQTGDIIQRCTSDIDTTMRFVS